jgi:uncharacterized protein (TIGR03435 family)
MSSGRIGALRDMSGFLRRQVYVIVALLAAAIVSRTAAAQPMRDGPAPPLSVEQLLNAPAGASAEWSDLKGKLVVVEFWATWCAPCIASIPHLNELAERFKEKNVVFISLTEEPRAMVEPFLKRKPIKGWVALDTDHHASEAYGVTGIPHTFIIGRDGRILGETHPSGLKAEHIENALRGEPLDLKSNGQDGEAEGATVAAARGKPTYSGSFAPGRFPAVGFDQDVLPEPLAQVIVRPALNPDGGSSGGTGGNRQTWLNADAADVVRAAYGRAYQVSASRVDLKAMLPKQKLDVAVWAPPGDLVQYRRLVEAGIGGAFGLAAHKEEREVDVLLLRAADTGVPRLEVTASTGGSMSSTRKENDRVIATFINQTTSGLAELLESLLNTPVINQTGLAKGYDYELVLPNNLEEARAALGTLGLKLVPARRRLTYLVVEKASMK